MANFYIFKFILTNIMFPCLKNPVWRVKNTSLVKVKFLITITFWYLVLICFMIDEFSKSNVYNTHSEY